MVNTAASLNDYKTQYMPSMFLQLRYIGNLIVRIVQPIANGFAPKRYGAFPKRTKVVCS